MNKDILISFKSKSRESYALTFYTDGTYQYSGYREGQYSYWNLVKNTLYFRHHEDDLDDWRYWSMDGNHGNVVPMLIEKLFELELEKELLNG